MKLQNDVIQALKNYETRLSDEAHDLKKDFARKDAVIIRKEQRTIGKLRKIISLCSQPQQVSQ